ncbi:MAG: FG-GAP-like repeat-containing protein, partial [Verrucomicrobia bacterium]|nr:FG-GAP-like repeat-containing protein [Verrucomicrobiota bacterium]
MLTDLLVTYEWGPVRFWKNVDGRLTDATAQAGLANLTGWWNGIAGGDIDNDGDIDYAVTNFGLNTKYHASQDTPALLYHGDFAGDGTTQLIEAEYAEDVLYPVRGKSCSTQAMPHLADRFKTFQEFAIAPLEKIYDQSRLDAARLFAITTLESGMLINEGSATFRFQPFPRIAQISPGFGVVLEDINADGNLDVYFVQNFWTPQIETGRMD